MSQMQISIATAIRDVLHRLQAQADNQSNILFYIIHNTTENFQALCWDLLLFWYVSHNLDNK